MVYQQDRYRAALKAALLLAGAAMAYNIFDRGGIPRGIVINFVVTALVWFLPLLGLSAVWRRLKWSPRFEVLGIAVLLFALVLLAFMILGVIVMGAV